MYNYSSEMCLREIAPEYLDKKILGRIKKGAYFCSHTWPRICPTTLIPVAAELYTVGSSRNSSSLCKVLSRKSRNRNLEM